MLNTTFTRRHPVLMAFIRAFVILAAIAAVLSGFGIIPLGLGLAAVITSPVWLMVAHTALMGVIAFIGSCLVANFADYFLSKTRAERADAVRENTNVITTAAQGIINQFRVTTDGVIHEQGRDMQALQSENDQFKSQREQAISVVNELGAQQAEARAKNVELTEELAEAQAKNSELTEELAEANAKNSELTEELGGANAQVETLTEERNQQRDRARDAERKVSVLKLEMAQTSGRGSQASSEPGSYASSPVTMWNNDPDRASEAASASASARL